MDISNIISKTAQTQQPKDTSKLGNSQLGKDGFLQLLVAQMKNQDPINPMDGTKFASQLAQFNSVEQLINVNDGIAKLAKSQNAMSSGLSNTMAATLTGKNVRAFSDKIRVQPGKEHSIHFKLNKVADQATVTISDAAGNIVRTEKLQNLGSGNHQWTWDGHSDRGNSVPGGTYSVQISAKNGDTSVAAQTFQEGAAEKVRYTGNGVKLVVNGVAIPLGDVQEIGV